MHAYLLSALCLSTLFCLSSCVEHRGIVLTDEASLSQHAQHIHFFQDGRLIEQKAANGKPSTIGFTSPLPSETHVDAWYRDEEGLIYRSHLHLLSPRPWWQRFPGDLFTDALWPGTINVDAQGTLHFEPIESLEPSYLDELAELHGYGKSFVRSE